MPRIFKGSESTLRLLCHTCNQEGKISDLKIALYTNDPSMAIEFTGGYTIEGNIVSLTVPNYAFGTMEDGVINYVAQGMIDDDTFLTERQSNYFLKTPTNYTPTPMPEEVVLGELTTMIVENGVFEYTPTDVDAWKKATIEVNVSDTNGSYNEGYNQGYEDGQNSVECPEGGTCNLGVGAVTLTTNDVGFYELYASDDGYDGWSKFIVDLSGGGAIKVHKAEELIQMFNEGWGIDFGAYYYVGGKITEIQEVSTEWGNATYTLDNGFSVYRGKWFDGNPFGSEDQIKVGAYIVVYGIIQEYNGVLGFKVNSQVIAYQECEGGEIVSCNLEDKWVTPSMGDRDDNGFVVVEESEGFDGLSRVVIDPTTIYNEGVSAGKAEGGDLNIDAVSTSLGAGNWTKWTRAAQEFGLDGITEITIDGSAYQEWTKAYTLLQAYQNTEEAYITENGEYRANIGYDGFALKGYNVGWVIDTVPTIDTDVEMWVKPYDGASNIWPGFIGSQVSDDDNTTFQIRKVDGSNAFSFRFGEMEFEYGYETERWYRLRMNRSGVWVNGEQVCGWDVQAFEENPNPLMINGIYNLNFENDNYRMNHASYGYVYFHNTDKLYVPSKNGLFIGNNVATIGKPATEDATLQYENNWYPKGYTKVVVDVQNGGGSGDCNIQGNKTVELDGEKMGIYPDEGYDGIFEVIVEAGKKAEEWREEGRYGVREKLKSIEITKNGRYSAEDTIYVESLRYNGGYHTDTISTYDINRIEVTFKADTSGSINGQGQPFILGGSLYGVNESGEDNACARAIQYAFGRIVGYWEGKWTGAVSNMDGEWLTITLDENGMTVKYPTYEEYCEYIHDNGNTNGGGDIFPFIIGGLGQRNVLEDGNYSASLVEDSQFRGLIKDVKINTNSMGEITYISKNWGYGVWDRIVENTGEYLSALEPTEGEITMNSEWERKYGEGWKEINVNIPTIQDSAKDYYYCPLILGDTGFGEAAKSWDAGMVTFNNYDGTIIEDKLYVPTFGNKNEFRTKEKAKFVQNLPDDVSIFGSMEFGDGVEYIRLLETKEFTNLTDLTIGPDMNTVDFGTSTFPTLRRIWCFSETDNIDVYFSIGSSFYDTGTLYLKNHNQESKWRNSLPSGWTIVLL